MSVINGTPVGSYSHLGKTFTLIDESGAEYTGVVVDNETVFTATDKQVYSGYVYAGDEGVSTGTRQFISYRTSTGTRLVLPNESFSIPLEDYDSYDYTKFQCMIAEFNVDILNSTSVSKISLNDKVFNVNSNIKLSDITKNLSTKSIDLNITNTTENTFVVYYFLYREETVE